MQTKLALRRAIGCEPSRLAWLALLLLVGVGTVLQSGLASGGFTPAQDEDDPLPRGAVQPLENMPPNNRIGRLRGAGQITDLNAPFADLDRSYSKMTRNGVTTTEVREGDLVIKIEETRDGIFMEIGRSYTRNDVDQLRSSHPDLAKALEAFPTEADGHHVQLSVRAFKKFEAINEDDLKEEHPEAFEQYERYVKNNSPPGRFRVEGFGVEFDIPEMRGFPNVRGLREQQEEMRREIDRMMERVR